MTQTREYSIWWAVSTVLFCMSLIAVSFVIFGLEACGTVAGTAIERKAFENSYQNSEARKTEIATYEAQLVELDSMLASPSLPDSKRAQLQGQRRALNIQLVRAREQLDNVYLK